jgi:hypothetical protein
MQNIYNYSFVWRDISIWIIGFPYVGLVLKYRKIKDRPRDPAKWDEIADVVSALSIPVIANGDVFEYEDFKRIKDATGLHLITRLIYHLTSLLCLFWISSAILVNNIEFAFLFSPKCKPAWTDFHNA